MDIPDARIDEAANAEANNLGADYAGIYVEQEDQQMLAGLDTHRRFEVLTGWQSLTCDFDNCMCQDLYSIKSTLAAFV